MNIITLAYLGDAVYELYIREHFIKKGIAKVKELQSIGTKYVSAVGQVKILEMLENKNFFTQEEMDIIKRGRNAHSHSSKSNSDNSDYGSH